MDRVPPSPRPGAGPEVPEALCRPDPLLDTLEAEAERHVSTRDGRRIAWRMWGEGRPLLFLHGGSGTWRHWVHQLGALRGEYRVVAPDLPGFGESDDPPDPVDFLDYARDVAAGIDAVIGGARYVVVPFSFGGAVTAQLLQVHPGRQAGLVLFSPAGMAAPSPPPATRVRGKEGAELVAAHRANLRGIMLADEGRIDPLALRIQYENTRRSRLRSSAVDRGKLLPEVLPGYDGPVSVTWGDRDAFMAPGALEDRRAALLAAAPDAEVRVLEGVGHWMPHEVPEVVTGIIRNFLERHPEG